MDQAADIPNINVVLVEPEIPPNTGSVARTCAAVGAGLVLIRPLGFDLDHRHLKRAGLDYWPLLKRFVVYDSWDDFLDRDGDYPLFLATTRSPTSHTGVKYPPGPLFLVFGRESRGLPGEILDRHPDHVRLPMVPGARSLNLSNAVTVVVYEVLRQAGFPGLT